MNKLNKIHSGATLPLALISAALGAMILRNPERLSRPVFSYPTTFGYYRGIGGHFGPLSKGKFGKCKNQPEGYYQQEIQEKHMTPGQRMKLVFKTALKANRNYCI